MALFVIDPNVFVSGLISAGPPAEIVDLVRYGEVQAVVCPHLLAEVEGVLRRPKFQRYVQAFEIDAYLQTLSMCTIAHLDPLDLTGIECRDPDDAYLIALAYQTDATALISGDRDLLELNHPELAVLTPTAILDSYDPVPRTPFQAVKGTFHILLSGPKGNERRIHRALQARGFVTQRTSGTEGHPELAWVQVLCHGGDNPSIEFQQNQLDIAQEVGADEDYVLRQHGIVIGGPSQLRIVRDRVSGKELFRLFGDEPEQVVAQLFRQLKLDSKEVVLEDPPGLWNIPEIPT